MAFQKEPAYAHGSANKFQSNTAVLLCNLGTPDAPTAPALRRYLGEFLSDHRVVEIPKPIWWLILHGIILRFRPAKSAKKYESIWIKPDANGQGGGSPLKVWSDKNALLLQGSLAQRGHRVRTLLGMRYGNPSIPSQLDALKAEGFKRILILPLYPQYSGTTSASVFDAVYSWASKTRTVPELRFVNHYHDHPGFIEALVQRVRHHWQTQGRADQLVMSFHGVPERTLHLGDIYHCECYKTARLLAERLGLSKEQYKVTFQSRFGKAKWLEPYTEPTLIEMAQKGVKSVEVICPGFPVDCLETLEEISMEAKEAYLHAGGKEFSYIPCLNDSQPWISALADIAEQHLSGWDTKSAPDAQELALQKQLAAALGAKA
ncbi:ferrochelatase [Variovorax sp. PCZ-1]|uniref:ferrochelatase n=1 Tax=Variovorax sp. PCZ-1 TaxID=2835533 RepID=UPI001BCFBCD8|nr:ferrochelatase [Variovorax sp. PCZ-1]MBS7807884.1 ferrochelatase [Variovorax sp. PCZ-1]